jgi:hypothetical protein
MRSRMYSATVSLAALSNRMSVNESMNSRNPPRSQRSSKTLRRSSGLTASAEGWTSV